MSDDRIVEYLRSRGRVEPPLDFVASVADVVTATPQRRASWFATFIPAAAAAGAVAVITALALILGQNPTVGPSPAPSTSDREAPGEVLLEQGDVVVMPAIDEDGEFGTVTIERGARVDEYEGWDFVNPWQSTFLELYVEYDLERPAVSPYGSLQFGITADLPTFGVPEGVVFVTTVRPDGGPSPLLPAMFPGAEPIEGWIVLEIPDDMAGVRVDLVYALEPSATEPNVAWSVPLQLPSVPPNPDSSPAPSPTRSPGAATETGALLDEGDTTTVAAVWDGAAFGTITIERGADVGGYPLVTEPSSEEHFFVELFVTYELEDASETWEWGMLDWQVRSVDDAVEAERLQSFVPMEDRPALGQWPGATVPEHHYEGWLIFAVPRAAADVELELVYQPTDADDPLAVIPVRHSGPAPAPVTAEWPRPDPVYVAQPGLPFSVLESAEADALFEDPDTCTNPEAGYTVAFPESWYTNTAIGDVPACSWFSPTFYEATEDGPVPDEIVISVNVVEGAIGFIWVDLYSEAVVLDGVPARRHETGMTKDVTTPTDQFQYAYLAYLDDDSSEGPTLLAGTDNEGAGDYELNKAVLDRIMASLEFTD